MLNFVDRSIYGALARELAFGAVELMPVLGEVTPSLVRSMADNLGWELRNSPGAVVNVWSTLSVSDGGRRICLRSGG